MKQTLIFSGLPPGKTGTGRLVEYLCKNLGNDPKFKIFWWQPVYTRKVGENIFVYRAKRLLSQFYKVIYDWKLRKIIEKHNGAIIFLHPQTIELHFFLDVLNKKQNIYLYVLDNSFFCVRSYNHLPGTFNPCFECIELGLKRSIFNRCPASPVNYQPQKIYQYLTELKAMSNKLHFFSQTKNQKKLLEKHFGNISCKVIGLETSDMHSKINLLPSKDIKVEKFDFVFHGSTHEAKGFIYILLLSRLLPEYMFLIPDSNKVLDKYNDAVSNYPNITFQEMTWESGLAYYVSKASVVLQPSLWSAPIEGAFIKSMKYNGLVAGCRLPFSFYEELPEGIIVDLDSNHPDHSANALRLLMKNPDKQRQIRNRSQEWLNNFFMDEDKFLQAFQETVIMED